MSNKNTKKTHRVPLFKRPIVIVSLVAILIAIVALTIWALINFSGSKPSDSEEPGSSQTTQPSKPQDPSQQQPDGDKNDAEPERPTQFEGGDPNELPELTGSIILNTHDASNLTVAVGIDQYLSSQGTCHLELSRDGRVLRTSDLAATADVTTSGCGPFIVPIAGLTAGTYQLKVSISGDNKTGVVAGEVQI